MIKTKSLLLAFCLGLCVSGPAPAAESPWYLGLKGGTMNVDLSQFNDATSGGVLLGYQFARNASGSFAVEGEYTNSSSENVTVSNVRGKWDIDTFAVYLAYRSAGDLYFKGKIGVLNEDVKVTVPGASISGTDTGASIGIGGGWRFGKTALWNWSTL